MRILIVFILLGQSINAFSAEPTESVLSRVGHLFGGGTKSKPRESVPREKCGWEDHAYFKKVLSLLDGMEEKVGKAQTLSAIIQTVTGKSAKDHIEHYKDLTYDGARLGSSDSDFGGGGNGYKAASVLFTESDIKNLNRLWPTIRDSYDPKTTWGAWVKSWDNDPKLALKAILASSNFVTKHVRKINGAFLTPFMADDFGYSVGILKNNAWNLDLSGDNTSNWGHGYKTVNGILNAFALWEKGYDREDVLFTVSRMHLLYEASDALVDHCGMVCEGVRHCRDATKLEKGEKLVPVLKKIQNVLTSNAALKRKMIGHIAGLPGVISHLPGIEEKFETNGESHINTMMLLLAQYLENESEFGKDWNGVLKEFPQDAQDILMNELKASKTDIGYVMNGSRFALDALKGQTPGSPKKGPGLLSQAKLIDSFLIPTPSP